MKQEASNINKPDQEPAPKDASAASPATPAAGKDAAKEQGPAAAGAEKSAAAGANGAGAASANSAGTNGAGTNGAAAGGGIQLDPGMSALSHVPVEVQVVLGGARMPIGNVLKLSRGAVVEIDRKVGEQVDIHINNRPVARGEIIIVDEDRLGVTLTEIINVQAGLR